MEFMLMLLSDRGLDLNTPENKKKLYAEMDKSTSFRVTRDNLGLGEIFQRKTRQKFKAKDAKLSYVEEAFTIDDQNKEASFKDAKALEALIAYLKSLKDKAKHQEAFMLALLCNQLATQADDKYYARLDEIYPAAKAKNKPVNDLIKAKRLKKANTNEAPKDKAKEASGDKGASNTDTAPPRSNTGGASNGAGDNTADNKSSEEPLSEAKRAELSKVEVYTRLQAMMATYPKTKKDSYKKVKQAQEKHFYSEILAKLDYGQLKELVGYMGRVQKMKKGEDKFFGLIRKERFSLFGGGNTDTWQRMFSEAKARLQLLILAQHDKKPVLKKGKKLEDLTYQQQLATIKLKKDEALTMDRDEYTEVQGLLSVHSGRWYARGGKTSNAKIFAKNFKQAPKPEEAKQDQEEAKVKDKTKAKDKAKPKKAAADEAAKKAADEAAKKTADEAADEAAKKTADEAAKKAADEAAKKTADEAAKKAATEAARKAAAANRGDPTKKTPVAANKVPANAASTDTVDPTKAKPAQTEASNKKDKNKKDAKTSSGGFFSQLFGGSGSAAVAPAPTATKDKTNPLPIPTPTATPSLTPRGTPR